MKPAAVVVSASGASAIRAGAIWIYRQDVVRAPERDARDGGPPLVAVTDGRGHVLGTATWAASARLALRLVERGDNPSPASLGGLISARLDAALARRGGLGLDRDAYRVVNAESDGLPGLFVDRYSDAAVLQTVSIAMDSALPEIASLVAARLRVRIVVARNDGSAREFEGLPRTAAVVAGSGATEVVYRLGPNHLAADLLRDGKTGGFLDQADNHAALAALAPRGARCLDAFTYHGGFALALARRGGAVLATDSDAAAIERCAANARRNQLGNLEARPADAFALLRDLESRGERFDIVVLDPPALAKRGGAAIARRDARVTAADRAYGELLLRGFRITAPGGLLCACSCSGAVTRAHWDELCAQAAAAAGRSVQILERRGASADHPELAGVPETGYLKCWILRVL